MGNSNYFNWNTVLPYICASVNITELPYSSLGIQRLPVKAESSTLQQKKDTSNSFSPNLDRVLLPYFRPALSQGKAVIAYAYPKHFTPEHCMTVWLSTPIRSHSRSSHATKLTWFLLPFPARTQLQGCKCALPQDITTAAAAQKCKASAGSWTQPLQGYQLGFRKLTLAVLFQCAGHTFILHFPSRTGEGYNKL